MTSTLKIIIFAVVLAAASAVGIHAQSSDQDYPTPITSNEISGRIRPRDVGDSRPTTHFYAFSGEQGDIFVNVRSKNFDGDIDVFTADRLRPLTRIVIYSDAGITETGRIVYLRKGERLLLRIEGRTPDDSPAEYTIKFAGSFVALSPEKQADPEQPKVTADDAEGVRLNSVGAVTERAGTKPPVNKVTERPPAESSDKREQPPEKNSRASSGSRKAPAKDVPAKPDTRTGRSKRPVVVVDDPMAPEADPLASIKLSIQLKNGKLIERPMSEVLRFSTDRGVMTVITKDGSIARYLITDVLKVIIQ